MHSEDKRLGKTTREKSSLQNGGNPAGHQSQERHRERAAGAAAFFRPGGPRPPGTPDAPHDPASGQRGGGTRRRPRRRRTGGWTLRAWGRGDPLTFSKPVLEVGVTPSLAVKVNAVPDEKSPADTGGDGTVPAHHLRSTEEQE